MFDLFFWTLVIVTFSVAYWRFMLLCRRQLAILTYLQVPLILFAIGNFVGEPIQRLHSGPQWLYDSLQDTGSATTAALFATFLLARKPAGVLMLPWFTGIMTVVNILWEVQTVTVRLEYYLAQGYSGKFDWLDTIAYLIGFVIVLINHFLMRGHLRPRAEEKLHETAPPLHGCAGCFACIKFTMPPPARTIL
jgi:hypothetical protein